MTVSGTNARRPGAAVRRGLAALAAAALLMPLASGVATAEVGTSAVQANTALTPLAPVVLPEGDQGFELMPGSPTIVENLAAYEIELVQADGGPDVESVRADVEYAIGQLNASGYLDLRLQGGTVPPTDSIDYGVIRVSLNEQPACRQAEGEGFTVGCAAPQFLTRLDGHGQAAAGRVRLEPAYFDLTENIRRVAMLHELLHALALDHYDAEYEGRLQVMASSRVDIPTLGAGDLNGLAFLASNRTSVVHGALDSVTPEGDGQVRVAGWALDHKTSNRINVTVTVDGVEVDTGLAGVAHPGLDDAYGRGDLHGFDRLVAVPDGAQEVCVIGRDSWAAIGDAVIGCRSLVPEPEIVGGLDPLEVVGSTTGGDPILRVSGWALDTSSDAPIDVYLTTDGHEYGTLTADLDYPGLDDSFGRGDAHGFRAIISSGRDTEFCALVRATDPDEQDTVLGCQSSSSVAWPADDGRPFGYIESVQVGAYVFLGGYSPVSDRVAMTANGQRVALGTRVVSQETDLVDLPEGQYFNGAIYYVSDLVGDVEFCLQLENADHVMVTVDCVSVYVDPEEEWWLRTVGGFDSVGYEDGVLDLKGWAGRFGEPGSGHELTLSLAGLAEPWYWQDLDDVRADLARPDIVEDYGLGSAHGFHVRVEVDLPPGTYEVQGWTQDEDGGELYPLRFEVP